MVKYNDAAEMREKKPNNDILELAAYFREREVPLYSPWHCSDAPFSMSRMALIPPSSRRTKKEQSESALHFRKS